MNFKELFQTNESVEDALHQTMQTIGPEVQNIKQDLADMSLDYFDMYASSSAQKEWNKMDYKAKLKLAKKIAKNYI